MKTIGELWEESNQEKGLKVRWMDWGHHYRFFEILSHNPKKNELTGILDNGQKISYPYDSLHWKLYESDDENCSKAV